MGGESTRGNGEGREGASGRGDDLLGSAKDAAYVAIGLGILGFQRAQVQRRELLKQLRRDGGETDLGSVGSEVARLLLELDDMAEPVVDQLDAGLEEMEERLPEQAREALRQARTTAQAARGALRSRLGDKREGS
jgi:hypothetical protein